MKKKSILEKTREICLSFPNTYEKESWGTPTFRVKTKAREKMFAMYADNHHGSGFIALWLFSTLENQELIVEEEPKHYFVPPYVEVKGWIGARLDTKLGWEAITDAVGQAYRLAARK